VLLLHLYVCYHVLFSDCFYIFIIIVCLLFSKLAATVS